MQKITSSEDPFRLLANCFLFFCRDLAVSIYPTLLADCNRPNRKSGQGLQSVGRVSYSPCYTLMVKKLLNCKFFYGCFLSKSRLYNKKFVYGFHIQSQGVFVIYEFSRIYFAASVPPYSPPFLV